MERLVSSLAEILEIDVTELNSQSVLEAYNWDSLAMVSTIAMFDELFDKSINLESLRACKTVGDLEALASA